VHKRLTAFEKRAIDGRQTRIDAAVMMAAAVVVTSVYVWWDRLLQLLPHGRPDQPDTLPAHRTQHPRA
jgi:hypothetical protein